MNDSNDEVGAGDDSNDDSDAPKAAEVRADADAHSPRGGLRRVGARLRRVVVALLRVSDDVGVFVAFVGDDASGRVGGSLGSLGASASGA